MAYIFIFFQEKMRIYLNMHFIYHDGTVKDVETLDQMYMKKPQKQLVRIAFDPGWQIGVNNQTNELATSGDWDVSESLVWSGTTSKIVFEWEILEIFFDNNNVVPKWIVGNFTVDEFDEESGEWTVGLISTVRNKF